MSTSPAQVDDEHREMVRRILACFTPSTGMERAAQLIADSEARAVEPWRTQVEELRGALALGQENCDDVFEDLREERDSLRAVFPQICAALGNGACCMPDVSVGFIESIPNEVVSVVAKLRAQVERLTLDRGIAFAETELMRDRAELAEAILGKLQEIHGCSQEMVVHWCERAAKRSLAMDSAQAELAKERARLDWLNGVDGMDWFTHCDYGTATRESIDAAMKEDARP